MLGTQLTGKYVKLELMNEKHLNGLYEAGLDEKIWSFMPIKIDNKQDMEYLIKSALQHYKIGNQIPYTIINIENNEIVGSTRLLDIQLENKNAEIGWTWLSPEVWRTRINTECKFLLLQYCFEKLNLLRVQLKTDGRNVQSQNAIKRIGAVKEGTLRKNRIMYDGYVRDSVYFSILAEEWPTVKNNLIEKIN
jgi:N-acetyltransferase